MGVNNSILIRSGTHASGTVTALLTQEFPVDVAIYPTVRLRFISPKSNHPKAIDCMFVILLSILVPINIY